MENSCARVQSLLRTQCHPGIRGGRSRPAPKSLSSKQERVSQAVRSSAKRPRVSLDVEPGVRRRLRLAAARRDVSVRQYVLEAIEERLREDLRDEGEGLLALNAKADPVLEQLWDN